MAGWGCKKGRSWEGLCHSGLPTLSKGSQCEPWEVTHSCRASPTMD